MISSRRSKTMSVDYSCIESQRYFIKIDVCLLLYIPFHVYLIKFAYRAYKM